MANTKEVKDIDPNQKLELSVTDILALITKLQADQAKLLADTGNKNAEVLSESLAKLSPHYKTPDQIANDRQLKAVSREGELNKLRIKKRQQHYCEHKSGQNGRQRRGESAFFPMKLCTGEVIAVCCYCQKVISSINPKHEKFWKDITYTLAESGQISGLQDPIEAALGRLVGDEQDRVRTSRAEYKKVVQNNLENFDDD
jgi:hypothetical protein